MTYGRNGRVVGLVFGAFGELSKNVYDLIDFISRRYALSHSRVIDASYSSLADLKAKKKNRLCMEWGGPTEAECVCEEGYTGDDCQIVDCPTNLPEESLGSMFLTSDL